MLFGRRSARGDDIPAPRASSSRSTPSRLVELPAGGPGWHNAVVHLEDVLSAWSLPVALARRWMQPARDVFASQAPTELFVQLDPVDGMVNVEIWNDAGGKLFEVEAYLGEPEVFTCSTDRRARVS